MTAIAPELVEQLRHLEQQLLTPEVRRDARAIEALLTEDFREIGASGRVFDREAIVRELPAESDEDRIAMSEFSATLLTGTGGAEADCDGALAMTNYVTTRSNGRDELVTSARRTSIWRRSRAEWRMCFHQGTKLV